MLYDEEYTSVMESNMLGAKEEEQRGQFILSRPLRPADAIDVNNKAIGKMRKGYLPDECSMSSFLIEAWTALMEMAVRGGVRVPSASARGRRGRERPRS